MHLGKCGSGRDEDEPSPRSRARDARERARGPGLGKRTIAARAASHHATPTHANTPPGTAPGDEHDGKGGDGHRRMDRDRRETGEPAPFQGPGRDGEEERGVERERAEERER